MERVCAIRIELFPQKRVLSCVALIAKKSHIMCISFRKNESVMFMKQVYDMYRALSAKTLSYVEKESVALCEPMPQRCRNRFILYSQQHYEIQLLTHKKYTLYTYD